MDASQIWILVSLAVLAAVALLVFRAGKAGKQNRLTPLAGLAFGFIMAGCSSVARDGWDPACSQSV